MSCVASTPGTGTDIKNASVQSAGATGHTWGLAQDAAGPWPLDCRQSAHDGGIAVASHMPCREAGGLLGTPWALCGPWCSGGPPAAVCGSQRGSHLLLRLGAGARQQRGKPTLLLSRILERKGRFVQRLQRQYTRRNLRERRRREAAPAAYTASATRPQSGHPIGL